MIERPDGEMIKFAEAVRHANAVGIAEEFCPIFGDRVTLVLKNGDRILFLSEYEGPYSEVTPGEGIQPPTCFLQRKE